MRRDRTPKPAFEVLKDLFHRVPQVSELKLPKVSVIICSYNGASTVESLDLTVQNRTPTASFTKPAPAVVGIPASFNAAASSDLDGSIVKYEWDFDGDDIYEVDAGSVAARDAREA